ncbi:LptA/OstA family protein [Sulfuriroseicoccus oceanibius]|uniref:Organic solvent tolerance-like N-terminal domain-containing protein n=1 Tax=Sulfuriroseicoccus oceanibius TaxID=2707525 RepID=A0A6B3L9S7_9BACT|nr:LptA/OstA family protein [Sulfuriroseicoccus oceanibius]QQL46036.1 hypothetical protein G3M56_005500 [Sulfuriroseicoccus oceanibius]
MMKRMIRQAALVAAVTLGAAFVGVTHAETPIQITSEGGASISTETNTLTYMENVVFFHADQNLKVTCDRLEIVQAKAPAADEAKEEGETEEGAEGGEEREAQIETAIAIGNVVITKVDADGNEKIGKCERAVFDAKTNNVTMSGSPSLLDRKNLISAAKPSTVFILKESGEHQFKGPIKTRFVGNDDAN